MEWMCRSTCLDLSFTPLRLSPGGHNPHCPYRRLSGSQLQYGLLQKARILHSRDSNPGHGAIWIVPDPALSLGIYTVIITDIANRSQP
jgi:hypothetical protein